MPVCRFLDGAVARLYGRLWNCNEAGFRLATARRTGRCQEFPLSVQPQSSSRVPLTLPGRGGERARGPDR